jgi:hypothetical protein
MVNCVVWYMLPVVTTITLWKQTPLVPFKITKENIGCIKVGIRFACKVGTCTQSYPTKWLLNKHLFKDHNLTIEGRKSRHPSTCEGDPRCQDHSIVNAWIFSDAHVINDKMSKKLLIDKIESYTQIWPPSNIGPKTIRGL